MQNGTTGPMNTQPKYRCMRCGQEWPVPANASPEQEERACPKCRSNSVRLMRAGGQTT